MAGELDLGSIVMRIRADMSGVQKSVDQLAHEMGRMETVTGSAGGKVEASAQKMSRSVQDSSIAQAAAYGAIAAAAVKAMSIISNAITAGIAASERYKAALIGLSSVAAGKGINSDAMDAALRQVTDAFFDAASASTAFKNLLSRGYDLDQATQSIIRLKDAAAFGRQASLSLADAVMSATEGLKNENSILVDNAGVTKNVSMMWKDYAKTIGVTVESMTTAQKVQAEVAGIMKETQHQVGDLAKATDTLAGKQAAAAQSGVLLAQAYGESMTPAVSVVTELLKGLTDTLAGIVQEAPALVSGATATSLAIASMTVATKAAQALRAFKNHLQAAAGGATFFGVAIKTALPWMAAIAAIVGVVTVAYTAMKKKQEEAAEKQREEAQKAKEEAKALQDKITKLDDLSKKYEELIGKTRLTFAESEELLALQKQLQKEYGLTGTSLQGLASDYGTVTGAIREMHIELLKTQQAEKDTAAASAKTILVGTDKYKQVTSQISTMKAELDKLLTSSGLTGVGAMDRLIRSDAAAASLNDEIYQLEKEKARLETIISPKALTDFRAARSSAAVDYVKAEIAAITGEFEIGGGIVNAAAKELIDNLFLGLAANPKNATQADPDRLMKEYAAALKAADIGPAMQAMDGINQKIMMGAIPTSSEVSSIEQNWSVISTFAQGVGKALNLSAEDTKAFAATLAPVMTLAINKTDELAAAGAALAAQWKESSIAMVTNMAPTDQTSWIGDATENARKGIDDLTKLAQEAKKQSDIVKGLNFMRINWDKQDSEGFKLGVALLTEYGEAAPKNLAVVNKEYENHSKILKGANIDQAMLMSSMQGTIASLKQYRDALDENSSGYKLMDALVAELETSFIAIAAIRTPELSLDPSKYISDLEKIDTSFKGLGNTAKSTFAEMEILASKIASDSKLQSALAQLKGEMEGGRGTGLLAESLREHIRSTAEYANAALANIDEVNAAIDTTAVRQAAAAGETELLTASIDRLYTDLIEGQKQFAESSSEYKIFEGLIAQISQWKAALADAGTVRITVEGTDGAKDLQELSAQLEAIGKATQDIRVKQDSIAGIQRLVAEAKKARTAGKDFSKQWEQITAFLGKDFTGSLDDADASIEAMASGTKAAMDSASSSLDTMEAQILSLIAAAEQDITISPQVRSANLGPLYALLAIINAIRRATGQGPIGSGGGGGGGQSAFQKDLAVMAHDVEMGRLTLEGELQKLEALDLKYRNKRGKSTLKTDDQKELDEQIYSKREELRKKALEDDYAALDHKKTLNTISVSDEIAALENIKTAHQLNAEEIMEIEEKLYDARTRQKETLYQWDIALLDHQLSTSEMSANEEIVRLERIRDAHELSQEQQYEVEERMYALRKQLQEAQESAVTSAYKRITDALKNQLDEQKDMELEALDDRIEELNALTKAENEAARKDDAAKNLADKQRELAVEKSARRRRELQEEIAEMEAAEALRLSQEVRQAEIDALNDQKKAVTDKYAELAKEESLRQEALRLVMSGNLQQMTDLIASYGEEWQDAGAQLAEALSSGLLGNSGAILDTINSLTTAIQDSINDQLTAIGMNLPMGAGNTLNVYMSGITIREEADLALLVDEMYKNIQKARR